MVRNHTMTTPAHLPLSRIAFYALPGFALAMPTIPAAVFLPSVYATELGLAAAGAELLTTEMVLFEWLRSAEHEHFKEIQALIK